ncbi:type I-B CRISPR-associated protein Cas5b [Anaerosalibacter bizertensis]|uniref:type I-B CRISPR-associated protein Cas5b n=1 Tax=Anaerosalibacter bizertensis TaxID=932217 RepID=UPI001C0EB3FB|nr:type I-B CRISPR-associated protein Cas5b [Anaerosalibacter bizertensis]MBU5293791.1 type I-B CRISPR-associated protein Cas5b [Anaerosalibacter bizertensis]
MKILVFDIWGDYGHFRKYFTTSSPLTFSFPPKTAIYGMISSILGYNKENYLSKFQSKSCKIAISIENPIKKTRIPINYIDTKKALDMSKIKSRTQVNLELIKDCKYRMYFYHEDEKVYNELKKFLENKKSVYTVSLGLSELLANYNFVGEVEGRLVNDNKRFVDINTVIPFEETIDIDFRGNNQYFRDTIYNEMNENREITEYINVLYEKNGKPIRCNIPSYYYIESGENIVFL